MKHKSLLLPMGLLCYLAQPVLAQKAATDSCSTEPQYFVGISSPNSDHSVYTAMQNIWYSNEQISYLAIPNFKTVANPAIPLRDGEGKSGFLFEGNLYHQAPIMMGRNLSNHLWQTSRLTFDYGFNIRMAKDPSNPLVPNNNVIGLTIDKILWDSYTRFQPLKRNSAYAFSDWNRLEQALTTVSLNITAHHFSNGQPPGFFLRDTINGIPQQRNNYLRGDFSTNYLQVGITASHMTAKRSIFSIKLAYQRDGNVFGPLSFSDEQVKSYGQDRLKGFIQYRFVGRKVNQKGGTTIIAAICDSCSPQRTVRLHRSYELLARLDYEYILGDLSLYPHQKKYRFNPHFYLMYTRQKWRALGFVFHYYHGRDYSNIRYDLPISTFMAGISINFNKFNIPFSNKQRFSLVSKK
ncbi:hypothetical protein DBR32_04820 [Taibaiella sp. KBW10]|nr:hypothetical protein DBR32_04820 [Taibaiella sp. KBW10]